MMRLGGLVKYKMMPPGSMGVHDFLRSSVPTLRSRVISNVDQWHPSDSCPISGSVTCYSDGFSDRACRSRQRGMIRTASWRFERVLRCVSFL